MLRRVKNRFPVIFGIVMVVLYLVVLNLSSYVMALAGGGALLENTYLLQFLGIVVSSFFMVFVVWRIGYEWIFKTRSKGFLYNIGTGGYTLTVSGIALASNLGAYLLTEEHVFRAVQPAGRILCFTVAMFGVGFSEELAFRGILTNLLREKFSTKTDQGIFLVVLIQGAVFGACHISNIFGGVKPESAVVQAVMAGLMGVMLGIIYLRTNSLWFVAFLHGLNDFCALYASGIYGINNLSGTINRYSWVNLSGAPVYLAVCLILLRRSKRWEIKEGQVWELPMYIKIIKGVMLTALSLFLIFSVFLSSALYTWTK